LAHIDFIISLGNTNQTSITPIARLYTLAIESTVKCFKILQSIKNNKTTLEECANGITDRSQLISNIFSNFLTLNGGWCFQTEQEIHLELQVDQNFSCVI